MMNLLIRTFRNLHSFRLQQRFKRLHEVKLQIRPRYHTGNCGELNRPFLISRLRATVGFFRFDPLPLLHLHLVPHIDSKRKLIVAAQPASTGQFTHQDRL